MQTDAPFKPDLVGLYISGIVLSLFGGLILYSDGGAPLGVIILAIGGTFLQVAIIASGVSLGMRHSRAVEYEDAVPSPPRKPLSTRVTSLGLFLPLGVFMVAAVAIALAALLGD